MRRGGWSPGGSTRRPQLVAGRPPSRPPGRRTQLAIVADFADGKLHGGAWAQLSVTHAFGLVMRVVLACFYSHPWAWNEIGFGGPAYPRGYSRFGSPDLQRAERETWEGVEHFDRDPVSGARERPPR